MDFQSFVADDIQLLQSGKPILVGLYPEKVISISIPEPERSALSKDNLGGLPLCVMLYFGGMSPGEYVSRVTVTYPGDVMKIDQTFKSVVAPGQTSFSLILRMQPFLFFQAGKYVVGAATDGFEPQNTAFNVNFV